MLLKIILDEVELELNINGDIEYAVMFIIL